MHLAEGTLPIGDALTWTALAAPFLLWSVRGELGEQRKADPSRTIVATGCMSLLFAVTLFPIPVPVVGATSHICLTPMVALLLGVRRTIWPTFVVLLLQALFFAHGGISTLGINLLTLGLVAPVVAWSLHRVAQAVRVAPALAVGMACLVADLAVYLADAAVLAFGLRSLASVADTFALVCASFGAIQIPLALREALVSVTLLGVLSRRRPDLLPAWLSMRGWASLPALGRVSGLVLLTGCLSGCDYRGLDDVVFGSVAEAAGRSPTSSWIDLSQGELGLAANILILFSFGFLAGRAWERLGHKEQVGPP